MPDSADVLVIGAGPAGSTIARLLRSWGHDVLMLDGPRRPDPSVDGLPPSIHRTLGAIRIAEHIAEAAFYRLTGSTTWWAAPRTSVEPYPGHAAGISVDRRVFDDLLTDLARREGVRIVRNRRAPLVDLSGGSVEHDGGSTTARFIVDATGRAGLLARQIRRFWDDRYRTLGLCGAFHRGDSEWDVDPQHTLVEAYESGWAWSVPLAPDRRYVCFLVDKASVRSAVEAEFPAALNRTEQFRRLFGTCPMEVSPWTRDASLYRAERYAGPHWILVGDAGSFVAPLSSSGLEKALNSACMGAAVVNTCLMNPAMADVAIEFFNEEEERTYAHHGMQAARLFAETAQVFGEPFWQDRAQPPEAAVDSAQLQSAYERLRTAEPVRFRFRQSPERRRAPALRGAEIVMEERATLPALGDIEHAGAVHLAALAMIASEIARLDALYEAYVERHGYVGRQDLLSALLLLIAKGAVEVAD